jgi:membrane-associated protein
MTWLRFISFSILGNMLWVVLFTLGGYFFGNIPVIKNNFTLAILGIILISVMPMVITVLKSSFSGKH